MDGKPLRTIVLLSGGLDSAVNLAVAAVETKVEFALTFDYGQRSAAKEIAAAARLCTAAGIEHRILGLPWLGKITSTALVDRSQTLPNPASGELDDESACRRSAAAVWVPNRNGLFVAIGAAFAESLGAHAVVAGFNAEEGRTFPDNSPGFLTAQNRLLSFSTMAGVRLISYTSKLDKAGIVKKGIRSGARLDLIWSCYGDEERHCRVCESCQRLRRALEAAGAWERLEASL